MDEMVMLPYIRLNLDTLQRSGVSLTGAAAALTLMAAAAAPRPAAVPNSDVASTSGTAAALSSRSRAMAASTPAATAASAPGVLAKSAGAPAMAELLPRQQQQVLGPLSTNAMPPLTASAVVQKLSSSGTTSVATAVQAATVPFVAQSGVPAAVGHVSAPAPIPASAIGGTQSPLSLEPSSQEFRRPATDDQEARNILATIFKRIGDKAQSNQVWHETKSSCSSVETLATPRLARVDY